jgi:hypothetical protein
MDCLFAFALQMNSKGPRINLGLVYQVEYKGSYCLFPKITKQMPAQSRELM